MGVSIYFELEQSTANKHLANKINYPNSRFSRNRFMVSTSSIGHGLNLRFTDPITKNIKNNKFKKGDEIILEWEQYPGATTYLVQIYEKSSPDDWSNTTLFKWRSRPELFEPHINLKNYDINLIPGKFYMLEITAHNESDGIISKTARIHSGYDFKITN